jgi:acyl-CoA thioesterase FadM
LIHLLTHIQARNYYSFIIQYKLNNRPVPLTAPPAITIFQPTIWTSTTPLGEIDVMGHKSNSTYFTDFDVARNYHICSLFRTGLKVWGDKVSFLSPQTRKEQSNQLFYVALAGVGFTFHKPIRPMQKYDIYTRVLSWDEKWLHLISHFVEEGACDHAYFSDQQQPHHDLETNLEELGDSRIFNHEADSQSVVLATGIAKIVFKHGRMTVSPPQFLSDCGLLPQQGSDVAHTSRYKASEDEKLTRIRESIEKRRARGHRVAEHIHGLAEGRSFDNITEKVFYSKF